MSMKMKYAEPFKLTHTHSSFMSVCQCGAVFSGSGDSYEAGQRAAREHQCPGPATQPTATEPQTWWHSFCDSDRPKGQQFLGALVMDVTADEINAIREEVDFKQMVNMVPLSHDLDVYGMAASIAKAHRLGVNPGGEVQSGRIDGAPEAALYPRAQLLSQSDVEALEPPPAVDAVGLSVDDSTARPRA